MLVEERIYTLYPGTTRDFMKLYQEEGLPVQRRYLKRMVGYYLSEIGALNQLIHLWAYDDFEQRLNQRQRVRDDPEFQAYWHKVKPLIQQQECKLLTPASMFSERLMKIVSMIDAE